jgi:hypothetical protein
MEIGPIGVMKRPFKFDASGFIRRPALITAPQAQLMEFLCGKRLKPRGADNKEFFHSSSSVFMV